MTMTTTMRIPGANPQQYGYADLWHLIELMTGDEKHAAAATSTLDVLWVLYDAVLDVSPETVDEPTRDRFFLSKGHGPMAYYAVLAAKGFLPVEWLPRWAAYDSPLGHHPDRNLVPGVEISSGSLGHGLPLAVGAALGLRAQGLAPRVVVLVGDAELDEGSNHEAVELAAALDLAALTVVVVDNRSASHAVPGRIAERFAVEGWHAVGVDGRDHAQLHRALTRPVPPSGYGPPSVVVAHVEGKEA